MLKKEKQTGEILLEKGLITGQQLKEALQEQKKTKEYLGAILLRNNWIKEKNLLEALSEQFNIPLVSLKNKYIDWELVKRFSSSLILDYKCFPFQKNEWSVTIAITNPLDAWALKRIEEEARGLTSKLVLVSQEDMKEAIQRFQQYIKGNISKIFD